MVPISLFRQLALSFEEATEQPHFGKPSFRVRKKIFATIIETGRKGILKLPAVEQSVFCSYDKSVIYPVEGTWGKQGWTVIELSTVRKDMLRDALTVAYCHIAPKRLSEKLRRGR